jgi:hypothetical protein
VSQNKRRKTHNVTKRKETKNTMALTLNNENYYSEEANMDYMSVSQFKDFAGTLMHSSCESTAYGKMMNEIPMVQTTPLLVGSYIDSYFEGTLQEFKDAHPEIISKTGATKGQLKADYRHADTIIERINADPLFSQFMSGQKQVIQTGNLFGVDWKIKMDSYFPDDKIVDLKVMRDMKPIWSDEKCMKSDFIRYWGYDIQGAVYQKIVEINTGKKLPFYIACATKEEVPDIAIIEITQEYLDAALKFVEENLPRVLAIKNGTEVPKRCETCAHCKMTKVLTSPISIGALIPKSQKDTADAPSGSYDDEDITFFDTFR